MAARVYRLDMRISLIVVRSRSCALLRQSRLLVNVNPYDFLEEAAVHFSIRDNEDRPDDEVVLAGLSTTGDEKLTGFALRIVLSDHVGIPRENAPNLLTEAEDVFAPEEPKVAKTRSTPAKGSKSVGVKAAVKKGEAFRKAA